MSIKIGGESGRYVKTGQGLGEARITHLVVVTGIKIRYSGH